MRSTYREKLLKSSCSCTLTFCQHLKTDESHVIIQSLEYPNCNFYIISKHIDWFLDVWRVSSSTYLNSMLHTFKFPSIKMYVLYSLDTHFKVTRMKEERKTTIESILSIEELC